jgi:hypothetical protein
VQGHRGGLARLNAQRRFTIGDSGVRAAKEMRVNLATVLLDADELDRAGDGVASLS